MTAHADWCRARGISTDSTAGGRRTLLRLELEGLEAVVERAERNVKHSPTPKDKERAYARIDALLHRIVQLNDELHGGADAGGPCCDACGELFADREAAWQAGYLCHRCTNPTERRR